MSSLRSRILLLVALSLVPPMLLILQHSLELRLKRLPVVVLTSSGETADVNRACELGANSCLVKPVSFRICCGSSTRCSSTGFS